MNLLDIIGPVMVGPSSSHTAGAVKIGQISRKLLGESIANARIAFHGSFYATGKGHGNRCFRYCRSSRTSKYIRLIGSEETEDGMV